MADLKKRILMRILPGAALLLTRLLFVTCRVSVQGAEHRRKCSENPPFVAVFWHFSLFYLFYHLRNFSGTVMVSASNDGDYLAQTVRLAGLKTVRGSSNRQGMRALREMINDIKAGGNGGIVADGSQGPALKVQPGVIMLASKSGAPILPISWAASRYITFKSWDRTALPLPFSRIVVRYGAPLAVPAGLDGEGLERYRLQLEKMMNELYTGVWAEFGKQGHA